MSNRQFHFYLIFMKSNPKTPVKGAGNGRKNPKNQLVLTQRDLGTSYPPPFLSNWRLFRTPTPKGFWSATRFNRQTGELLVQLGAKPDVPNAALTIGYQFVGFETEVYGSHRPINRCWISNMLPFSVSLRPNGGSVAPWGYSELKQGGQVIVDNERLLQGQNASFIVCTGPAGVGKYRLRVGVYLRMAYKGLARPYGEIITNVTNVKGIGIELPVGKEPQPLARKGRMQEQEEDFLAPADLEQALEAFAASEDAMVRELSMESLHEAEFFEG